MSSSTAGGPIRAPAIERGELVVGYLLLAVMAATGLPTPLYPKYKDLLGLSSLDITAVYGTYALVVLVVLMVAGGLSDRIGRRRVLVVAVATAAAGEIVLLLIPAIGGLYAGRALTGVSTGLVLGSATAYLGELAGPGHARRASATAVVANLGGQAVGTAVSGVCARYLPEPLVTPYLVGLLMLAPVALLRVWRIPETVSPNAGRRRERGQRQWGIPAAVRRQFWATAAVLLASFSLLGFLTALTGAIMTERMNQPGAFSIGLVTAGLFAGAALTQLAIPQRFFRPATTAAVAALPLAALILALADLARSLPLLLAAVLLSGSVVGVTLRAGIGSVLEGCPPARRGQVSSALFVAVYAGASIPTIAAGLIATLVSLTAAVIGLGAFVIALAAVAAAISVRASGARRSASIP